MKTIINHEILNKYNLDLYELLVLCLKVENIDINKIIESLKTKGLIDKDYIDLKAFNIVEETISIEKDILNKDQEFIELAQELRELYPTGRKQGTAYMWRSTVNEVARKLKTLVEKYNYSFTKEQAIAATKAYIQSFHGDYRTMRLLKYFILKSEKDADDNINTTSEFMSLIENENQINENRNDWVNTLV